MVNSQQAHSRVQDRSKEITERDRDRPNEITERTVVKAIRNQRRRYAFYYLHKRGEPVALEDVVLRVAAWEACTTPEEVKSPRRRSVYTSLYQTHLPHLEERGLVTFDRENNRIASRLDDADFEFLLANDPLTEVAWHRVDLVLAVGSVVLLALARYDVPPFEGLSVPFVAVVSVLLFALAGILHWCDVYRWQRRTEDVPPDFYVSLED